MQYRNIISICGTAFWVCHSTQGVFTKILAPVLGLLRAQGILVLENLDDLLGDHSLQALEHSVACTVRCLENLGWVINTEKSALRPAQSLKYLALILDTVQARVFLPPIKICALKDQVHQVRSTR